MKIEQIRKTFGSWTHVVEDFAKTPTMDNILKAAVIEPKSKGIPVWPTPENIFKCFRQTNYNKLVGVWIGQDPYPGTATKCVATGISMGVAPNEPLPPTLKAVNTELLNNYPNAILDPTLESWAEQGFLMLNTALTVEAGKIGSHINIWKSFSKYLLQELGKRNTGLIYVALGAKAQEFLTLVPEKNNYFIRAPHPAAEAYTGGNAGFYHSDLFKRINKIMFDMYGYNFNFGQS